MQSSSLSDNIAGMDFLLALSGAGSKADLEAAASIWGGAAVNIVYASASKESGYLVAGR